jgi:ribosomal protein S1
MFAFVDPTLQQENLMKIGTCKSRRTADIPAQAVSVDPYTRRVGSSAKQGEKDKQRERQREANKQTEASSVAAIKHHVPEPGMIGWEPKTE